MKNVSIKGLLIAIVVTLLLDTVGGVAGIPLFAKDMSDEAIMAIYKQTNFLIYALVAGLLTTFLGGYICGKYGKYAPYKNSIIFGVLGVVIGLVFVTFDPLWFDIIGL